MATNGSGPGGAVVDDRNPSDGGTSFEKERPSHDPEKQDAKQQAMANKYGKEDPFGDESNSDVKYKTMAWWYDSP